jgi:hypothetical protein
MGERKAAYRILFWEIRGRLLGRPSFRWEDNIKIDLYALDIMSQQMHIYIIKY